MSLEKQKERVEKYRLHEDGSITVTLKPGSCWDFKNIEVEDHSKTFTNKESAELALLFQMSGCRCDKCMIEYSKL